MKKSLADSRDFNAKRRQNFAWRKIAKLVGSSWKGCDSCGVWEMRHYGKRSRKYYFTGRDVWRSYSPAQTEWTYYCYECSATDLDVRNNADDVGEEYRAGPSELMAEIRRKRAADSRPAPRPKTKPLSEEDLDRLAESVKHIFNR